MRASEGGHLRADLDARRAQIGDLFERAGAAAAAGSDALRARLAERVRELRVDPAVDETLVAQEVVRFANRSDITEETVRFRAHLEHWRALSDGPEPCGRKLDFLLQEMNREVNTLGSKAEGTGVTELVVALKAELEEHRNGVLVSQDDGEAVAYALWKLQERGRMFVSPGEPVYEGMIIGIHSRDNDLVVNPIKTKQLTNIRASGKDEAILLTPPIALTLEYAVEFIGEDELAEITPKSIRLRKRFLKENERKRAERAAA